MSNLEPITDRDSAASTAAGVPLFVDLDESLIATDSLWESILLSVKRHPRELLRLPLVGTRNLADFKQRVAALGRPDVQRLPYREEVLSFLRAEHARGRPLILATASDRSMADDVARHLQLFDDVLASDGVHNLKGSHKLEAIRNWCRERGHEKFAYLGDCAADVPIWQGSSEVYVVRTSARVMNGLERPPTRVFERPGHPLAAVLRAIRPQQWVKNLLIFLPILLAHKLAIGANLMDVVAAVIAFSACASSVYVVNDLLDIEADRHHPRKRRRPFAAGTLPVTWGPPLAVGLLLIAFGVAALVSWEFVGCVAVYLTLSTLYTMWLKREALVDVMLLAGLYTLRILAGGVAAEVPVSEWLLTLSVFLFMSLAFAKRYAELSRVEDAGDEGAKGRGYLVTDLGLIETIGPTSGYLAVLVLALYIHSDTSLSLYPRPWALWLICPLMLYWVSRLWLLAKRRRLDEDPLVFAFKDRVSLLIGGLTVALAAFASVR